MIRPGGVATKAVVKQVLNEALVNPVTSKHRSSPQGGTYKDDPDWSPAIGTPSDRVGPGNPYAYSKSQRANIKFMKANKPGPSSSSQPKQDARAIQPFTSWSDETQPGYKNIHARSLSMGKHKHEDGHISDIESISEQDEEKPQRSLAAEIVVNDVNEHNSQIPMSPDITFNEPRDYDPIISSSPLVYIRDIDGEYNTWDNSQISSMLKRRDSVVNILVFVIYL